MTARADVDVLVKELESQSWAVGTTVLADLSPCAATPHFPSAIRRFVRPLEDMMDDFYPQPSSLYEASQTWLTATGNVADTAEDLNRLRLEMWGLEGNLAQGIAETLIQVADDAHDVANWTKVVSQALELCVTIFESVRIAVCQALNLLAEYARTFGDVFFGSWPWEASKKADAVWAFAREVERAVEACATLLDQTLQAGRDLVRLLADLQRAIYRFHDEVERILGNVAGLIPEGEPPAIEVGTPAGDYGEIYYPPKVPFDGSDLRIDGDYPLGYHHSYDLGATDLSQEELMTMFQENFGRLFVPGQVGDHTQLNMHLTHEGQLIETSLMGTAIPKVTTGMIEVRQITADGFSIIAEEDHPEYPGEVAFRLTVENGRARLQVAGAYEDTVMGRHDFGVDTNTNQLYGVISNHAIWADMSHSIQDMLQYG